jgi:undecaprenyl-diphosphatase
MKWLKIAHIDAAQKYFNAHGGKSIFIGRFIGPIRSVISIVAGMSHMKTRVFNFYNAIGALVWAACYITLGYFFGQEWRAIDAYMRDVTRGVMVAVLVVIAGYVAIKYIKHRNKKLSI